MTFTFSISRRVLRVFLLAAVFSGGYLLGAVTQPTAEAQMGELGKKAMDAAGDSGGALGGAAKLGTQITEMRDHVNALSANLDQLDKIKGMLGGG